MPVPGGASLRQRGVDVDERGIDLRRDRVHVERAGTRGNGAVRPAVVVGSAVVVRAAVTETAVAEAAVVRVGVPERVAAGGVEAARARVVVHCDRHSRADAGRSQDEGEGGQRGETATHLGLRRGRGGRRPGLTRRGSPGGGRRGPSSTAGVLTVRVEARRIRVGAVRRVRLRGVRLRGVRLRRGPRHRVGVGAHGRRGRGRRLVGGVRRASRRGRGRRGRGGRVARCVPAVLRPGRVRLVVRGLIRFTHRCVPRVLEFGVSCASGVARLSSIVTVGVGSPL